MGAVSKPAGKDAKRRPRPEPRSQRHIDELLDAALADTFPASDPVSGLTASAPTRRPPRDESQ
jgi:hypothetical protein